MKKITLVGIIFLMASCGFNKEPIMKLKGEIQNLENGKIYLNTYKGYNDYVVIDSADVVNGKFEFNTSLKDTISYLFLAKPSGLQFGAILENADITIKGDANKTNRGALDVEVKGSYNDSLSKVANGFYQNLLKADKYAKYNELIALYEKEKDAEKKWAIKEEMAPYQDMIGEEVKKLQIDFIRKHSNTYAAASLMMWLNSSLTLEELKTLYNLFPERLKKADVLADTREEIAGQERMQPGKPAPAFTLKNPEGKDVSIGDFKGKVVLVDFWASWCRPCRASFPHLKKLYKKYKSKGFEIIGISNDSNHDAWKKAIKDDGIDWVQTVDEFPEKYKPARLSTLYAVHFLPTTYLIDRQGTIIGKIKNAEELDKKLEEIFGF